MMTLPKSNKCVYAKEDSGKMILYQTHLSLNVFHVIQIVTHVLTILKFVKNAQMDILGI